MVKRMIYALVTVAPVLHGHNEKQSKKHQLMDGGVVRHSNLAHSCVFARG